MALSHDSPYLCCTISGSTLFDEQTPSATPKLSLDEVTTERPFFLLPDGGCVAFSGESSDTVKVVAITHPHPKEIAILQNAALTPRVIQVMKKSIIQSGRRKHLPYLIVEDRLPTPRTPQSFQFAVYDTATWALHCIVDAEQLDLSDTARSVEMVLSPSGTQLAVSSVENHRLVLRVYGIKLKCVTHHFATAGDEVPWSWTTDGCIAMVEHLSLFVYSLAEATEGSNLLVPFSPLSSLNWLPPYNKGVGPLVCSPDGRFVCVTYKEYEDYAVESHAVLFQIKTTAGDFYDKPQLLINHMATSDGGELKYIFSPPDTSGLCDTFCLAVWCEETFTLSFKQSAGWSDGLPPVDSQQIAMPGITPPGGVLDFSNDEQCISYDGSLLYALLPGSKGLISDQKRFKDQHLAPCHFAMAPKDRMCAYNVSSAGRTALVVQTYADDDDDVTVESRRLLPAHVVCVQIEFTPDGKYIVYRSGTGDIFVDFATLGQSLEIEKDDDCSKLLPADVRCRLGQFVLC